MGARLRTPHASCAPHLRILFITGYAENAAIGNGYLENGMEVLTKPFEINALSAKVREILDR